MFMLMYDQLLVFKYFRVLHGKIFSVYFLIQRLKL